MGYISWMIIVVFITAGETAKKPSSSENLSLTPFLNKKYELRTSDKNFPHIMRILRVGLLHRIAVRLCSPTMELTENDGVYYLYWDYTFRSFSVRFRMDRQLFEHTPDGRFVLTTFTQDKNKLIQVQRGDGKTVTITREFTAEKVTVTVEVDGVVSVRVYKPPRKDRFERLFSPLNLTVFSFIFSLICLYLYLLTSS